MINHYFLIGKNSLKRIRKKGWKFEKMIFFKVEKDSSFEKLAKLILTRPCDRKRNLEFWPSGKERKEWMLS